MCVYSEPVSTVCTENRQCGGTRSCCAGVCRVETCTSRLRQPGRANRANRVRQNRTRGRTGGRKRQTNRRGGARTKNQAKSSGVKGGVKKKGQNRRRSKNN